MDDGSESKDDNKDATDGDEATETEAYSEPAPVITVEDPGEFKPQDYSFKVKLADGKSVTIKTPEDAEAIADNPDNFETPKQLMEFINKQNKMNQGLDKDREKYDTQKKTFDEQSQEQQSRQENVETLANEMEYLVSEGLIPAVAPEYRAGDWADPEVAKQPGVKEQMALINFMVKANEKRAKAGVKPITSAIDAHNAWMLDKTRIKSEQDSKKAGEDRKAAGARVAGVSATEQQPYVPKGIAVGNPNVFKRSSSVWDN